MNSSVGNAVLSTFTTNGCLFTSTTTLYSPVSPSNLKLSPPSLNIPSASIAYPQLSLARGLYSPSFVNVVTTEYVLATPSYSNGVSLSQPPTVAEPISPKDSTFTI